MMFGGLGWGGMFLGPIFMILFWVFLIAGVVWLFLAVARQSGDRSAGTRSPALAILAERLAKGEIDVEEYKARAAAIGDGR